MFLIYKITNSTNGKMYVGKTEKSIDQRWLGHLRASKQDLHGMLIARAIKKYGPQNFSILEIDRTAKAIEVDDLEKKHIHENDCCILDGPEKGYNMTRGGDGWDSEHTRMQNLKRVADGTHPWAGERGSILNRKTQMVKIKEGRHHFAGEKGSTFMKEEIKRRTANGTNAWAGDRGSEHSKRVAKKCLEEGRHHTQQKLTCPHCKKEGAGNSMKKWHFDRCRSKVPAELADNLRCSAIEPGAV